MRTTRCLRQAAASLLLAAFAAGNEFGAQDPQGNGSPSTERGSQDDGKTTTAAKIDLELPQFTSDRPRFCKLIYGLEEVKPLVWVVFDGLDVYCDINRNGDLTEPGEKNSHVDKGCVFAADGIEVRTWKTYLKSTWEGMLQGALFPTGGPTPEKAHVYHIGGPFRVLQGTINNRLGQKRDDVLFYTAIGTEYPGVKRTELRYECFDRDVEAELSIRYDDGSTAEVLLDHRC